MQQIHCFIDWGWWGFVHWCTPAAKALKEHLDCSLSSISIQCCFNRCFRVPTIFLIQVTCHVNDVIRILLFISGCRLVLSINACVSTMPGDAPVPRIWTPNPWCPALLVHCPPTLARFQLLSSQAAQCMPFSWLCPPHVP